MASKRKCGFCKEYFGKDKMVGSGVTVYCSQEHMFGKPTKPKKESAVSKRFTTDLKTRIRKRDNGCVFRCGRKGLEVHHIVYRSEKGGKDYFGTVWDEYTLNHPSNLITLCDFHHKLVHSDKDYWQPIMRGYIWHRYFTGKILSISKLKKGFINAI